MRIRINGVPEVVPDEAICLEDMVMKKGLVPERMVVELNLRIVPREEWRFVTLKGDDEIEIVSFVGGG